MMNGDNRSLRPIGTSFQCYFCGDNIPNAQQLQYHMKQCGSILDKCPEGCGTWIERRNITSHKRQCYPSGQTKSLPTRSTIYEDRSKMFVMHESFELIKKDVEILQLNLNDGMIQRENLKAEIEKMKRQYVLSEDRNRILVTTLTALRKSTEDDLARHKQLIIELNDRLNGFEGRFTSYEEFLSQIELRIDNIQHLIEVERNERSHLEMIVNSQDGKLRNVNKIESDLEAMKIEKTDNLSDSKITTIDEELKGLKNLILQENLLNKQQTMDYMTNQKIFEAKIKDIENFSMKIEKINYELKTLRCTVEEDSSTLCMMDRSIEGIKQSNVSQISPEFIAAHIESSGHLIWKIENYYQKMKDAVDSGSILLSPVFRSSKYGYTLQAEINLNGNGKWRGRHITATVAIVAGEYDPILEWPALLHADIIIKDQTPKRSKSIDIVKTLTVKNEADDKSKTGENSTDSRRQYIFVPHTSIDKLDYVKNNTMFVEIIAHK